MAPSKEAGKGTTTPPALTSKKSDYPNFLVLRLVREKIVASRRGFRRQLYQAVVELCEIGEYFKTDINEWRSLIEADWGKLKPPKLQDQENALRHVIRWAIVTSGMEEKQASFYYRAVAPLVAKGLKGQVLFEALQKEGLRNLQTQHSRSRKSQPPKSASNLGKAETISSNADAAVSEIPSPSRGPFILAELRIQGRPNNLHSMKTGSKVRIEGKSYFKGNRLIFERPKIKVTT